MSEIEETAVAVQEVAKTAYKITGAAEKMGSFVAKVIGAPLEEAVGIVHDRLVVWRWEKRLALMSRAEELLKLNGLSPRRTITPKLAFPLLDQGSLEDEEFMQDFWAKLLVNAMSDNIEDGLKRIYIEILGQINSTEALMLNLIYGFPFAVSSQRGIQTHSLPKTATLGADVNAVDFLTAFEHSLQGGVDPENEAQSNDYINPSEDTKIALINLQRLGCVYLQISASGGPYFKLVYPTLVGKRFIDACTLPVNK